jgi:hypothetical protein
LSPCQVRPPNASCYSLSTAQYPICSCKLFRITFFADPHPLTLIESHSYKNHGWHPSPRIPVVSHFFHSRIQNRAQLYTSVGSQTQPSHAFTHAFHHLGVGPSARSSCFLHNRPQRKDETDPSTAHGSGRGGVVLVTRRGGRSDRRLNSAWQFPIRRSGCLLAR